MTKPSVSRRGFVELLGSAALIGLAGTARAQVIGNDDFPGMYGLLVGPERERPAPDGPYIDQWDSYRFVYVATDTGARYWIDNAASGWSQLQTDLIHYDNDDLPPDPDEGHLSFNHNRKTIQWYDGNNWEWPTFVDNADVTTGTKTVANTTVETEIYRARVDKPALDMTGRVMNIFVAGVYSTASSNDGFTFRVYIGPAGFDPTAGEGTEVASITTVQENVTDGPFQSRTMLVINSAGATGQMANHTHAAFNDNPNDLHDPSITVDTTVTQEFAGTVQWNNAKVGNTMTRGIAYLQQSA